LTRAAGLSLPTRFGSQGPQLLVQTIGVAAVQR
jgi:hypothetical protein